MSDSNKNPEQKARDNIDRMLHESGWVVQDKKKINFNKMADEYSKPPYNREIDVPDKYSWPQLSKKRGAELESLYLELLQDLGKRKGARKKERLTPLWG